MRHNNPALRVNNDIVIKEALKRVDKNEDYEIRIND